MIFISVTSVKHTWKKGFNDALFVIIILPQILGEMQVQ